MSSSQATLCYIVKDGKVLLIHKLRGVGAGKINGPGGKVEPNEIPLAAAVRETEEETGVTPLHLQLRGELWFRFKGSHDVHCLIYLADDYVGQPRETDEAVPEWFAIDAMPYERMWEDDRHWLPMLLRNERFQGDVTIDNGIAHGPIFNLITND